MILLLDPCDAIFGINQDLNSISQKDILKALSNVYKMLSNIPDELLQKVTEIKFINPEAVHLYTITENTFQMFLKTVSQKPKRLFQLINKSSMHNFKSMSDSVLFSAFLKESEKGIVFFNILLTNSLIEYISCSEKITGYRLIKENDYSEWVKIEDIERYLSICSTLFYKFIGKQNFNDFLKESRKEIRNSVIASIINKIEDDKLNKHLCLYNNWEDEDFEELISALKKRFGVFELYHCEKGDNYSLPKKVDRLFIFDLDILTSERQISLIKELVNSLYKDTLVIIFTKTAVDLRPFPELAPWVSTESSIGMFSDINDEILRWAGILDSKLEEYKRVIGTINTSERRKKKYIKEFNDYVSGKFTFDTSSVDFWYDLKHLELYDKAKLREWAKQLNKKYLPDVKKVKYEFYPEGNYWTIVVNGFVDMTKEDKKKHSINFTKSKAIRYLVYVIKYFDVNNPISFEDLSRSISKWMDGEEKEVRYHTFSESVSDLFKNYPFLKPIDKYLHYNQYKCYYQENNEIEFDLTNIDIPYQHLDSKK